MKTTATKLKPSKATVSAADAAPFIENAPAPAGSLPDAKAVAHIQALRLQLGGVSQRIEDAQRALRAAHDLARPQILERQPGRYFPDTPLETIWSDYTNRAGEDRDYDQAVADLSELYGGYEQAKRDLGEALGTHTAVCKQLHLAINAEGGKVSVALRARADELQAQAQAAIASFCAGDDEAKEAAKGLSKVENLGIAALYWWGYSATADAGERASRFLSACDTLGLLPAQNSQGG